MTRTTTRADGERTRAAILRQAVSLAAVDGLDGLTIGHLAGALDMSKSGLYAHFGSKQELQLAIVEEAGRIFDDEVIQPGLESAPGLARLLRLCDSFLDHLERQTFPGGCFFSGAALELAMRPSPVNERVAGFLRSFAELIRVCVHTAIAQRELPATEDPDEVTLEIHGILLAANTSFVVHHDQHVFDLARRTVHRRLGAEPAAEVASAAVVAAARRSLSPQRRTNT
jgi:AcrR family transcriptional regulator